MKSFFPILGFRLLLLISTSLSLELETISFPILYDYENEQMFFIVQFGLIANSRFYPVSLSSKYNVIYTFGKEIISSTMIVKSDTEIFFPSLNITGKLATDQLHFGEFICHDFEFILNTSPSPTSWRKFLGFLTLSRSPHSFHNQLSSKGKIHKRIIEFDSNAMLRIGDYNHNNTLVTCPTIINEDYWSCTIKGLAIGEMSHHSQYIEVTKFKHYLPLNNNIATFHSMEVDITAPYEYKQWFKKNYIGLLENGEMKDNCNEVEDEDSQGHVIVKLVCYDKMTNTYDSVALFLGKELTIIIPSHEMYSIVKLQDKTVKILRIQFKQGLIDWNIGWRLLKNNNVVMNDDENTVGFTLSNTVFVATPIFSLTGKFMRKVLLDVLIGILGIGTILGMYTLMVFIGKDPLFL